MSNIIEFKHPVCRERLDDFTVTLMVVSTFTSTADVQANGPKEAGECAAAALRELIADLPKPSIADSYDVEISVVRVDRV